MIENQSVSEEDLVPGFQHIVVAAGYLGGRPALLGRRISVDQILHWLGEGLSVEEIHDLYELEPHIIREALNFAACQMEKFHVAG